MDLGGTMIPKLMIQKIITQICCICIVLFGLAFFASGKPSLIGAWRSSSALGDIDLFFQSSTQLVFDGETTNYTLSQNIIRVQDGDEIIDYPYMFSGSNLIISFPEGYQLTFTKVGEIQETPTQSKSTKAAGPNNTKLASEISGIWWGYTDSTERKIGLCPNSIYQDYTESSYSGRSTDSLGNENLAWGTANQSGGQGTWSIQGDFQQGTIFVQYADGRETRIHYEQCGDVGCLLFNGHKLCRSGRCE